jgi:protein TonB
MPLLKKPKADLMRKYHRYLKISYALSLALLILAFKFSPGSIKTKSLSEIPQDIIKVEDIMNTVQKPDIPQPPKAPQIIEASINVPEDVEVDNVEIDEDANIGPPDTPPTNNRVIETETEIFVAVEQMPELVGGLTELKKKIYYTEIARRVGIEGTVYIEAIIDEKGNILDSFVKRDIGGGLGDVALNAVRDTKFKPGMQRGKAVKVRMIIPIKFVLK